MARTTNMGRDRIVLAPKDGMVVARSGAHYAVCHFGADSYGIGVAGATRGTVVRIDVKGLSANAQYLRVDIILGEDANLADDTVTFGRSGRVAGRAAPAVFGW